MDALDRLFKTDRIDIFKPDGSLVKADVPAQVERKQIMISDVSVTVECGYRVTRSLPSGFVEVYIVDDPGFTQGTGPLPPQYCMVVRRKDAITTSQVGATYNVFGANPRLNIGSYGASQNVIFQQGSPSELFEQLREAAGRLPDPDRQSALQSIGEMEEAQGKPSFLDRYKDFMDLAASHVIVFAPFMPALASLLPHARP